MYLFPAIFYNQNGSITALYLATDNPHPTASELIQGHTVASQKVATMREAMELIITAADALTYMRALQ